MNSPPTPPYCGFALDEFTDKMRFLPGKGFVYRLAMDATRQGDDVAGWKSGACSGFSSWHSIKGSSEPFASSARGFSGFCLSFVRSIYEHQCFKNKNFSPLIPINCLIKCLINFWTFLAFRVPKPINGSVAAALHLMNSQIRCGSCREKVFFRFLSLIHSFNLWAFRASRVQKQEFFSINAH